MRHDNECAALSLDIPGCVSPVQSSAFYKQDTKMNATSTNYKQLRLYYSILMHNIVILNTFLQCPVRIGGGFI
jgi:hypothetical protein